MHQSEETIPASNKHSGKRHVLIIAGVVSVLILGGATAWYYYSHRYIAGKVTFQEYAPSYLPTDVHVTNKSIDARYIPSGRPTRYTTLNIELNNGFISNGENIHNFRYTCPAGQAVNETCSGYVTPDRKRYILTTGTYTNDFQQKSMSQRMEWLEGETYVMVNLESKNDRGYSQETLDKVVDSFKPVHFEGLPFNNYNESKI